MNARSRPSLVIGTIVAFIGVYIATYVFLARPQRKVSFVLNGAGPWRVIRKPDYRMGRLNVVIEKFFLPAYLIDTKVRPSFWEIEFPVLDFSRNDADARYVETK